MTLKMKITALSAAAVLSVFAQFTAMAAPYAGFVTAESRYGNGIVRAPVRVAEFGYQVKLPGGPWIYCVRSSLLFDRHRPCSETLRRETIDFWETRSEDGDSRD